MKRIRYKKSESGLLVSSTIQAGTLGLVAQINPETFEYSVVNADTMEVLLQGQAKIKAYALKEIKNYLIAQGAVFEADMRNKTSINVPKIETNIETQGVNLESNVTL